MATGSSALLPGEEITVCCDTLTNLVSHSFIAQPVFNTPDSFLLGECNDTRYGTLKAEILTQFACPINAVYPDSSELDSVCLFMYYRAWHGDGQAPLRINAYLMDKEALYYDSLYYSDIDINRYVSYVHPQNSALMRPRIISAQNVPDSTGTSDYYYILSARLKDEVARKLFYTRDFSSQEAFTQAFKGLYITTDYGSSTILYVSDISLACYFHYTYKERETDTEYISLPDTRIFPANSEVRQINRFEYPDAEQLRHNLCQVRDTNYILSPANIYTTINIPTKAMRECIGQNVGEKRPYINLASLMVDVLNYPNTELDPHYDDWAHPASTMMLIKQSEFNRFFAENDLPDDSYAICSSMTTAVDSNDVYWNYYHFDLSTIFSEQLRDSASQTDTLQMILVPVQLGYTTSSSSSSEQTISSVRIEQAVTATEIRSTLATDLPMDIELVYSGFDVNIIK